MAIKPARILVLGVALAAAAGAYFMSRTAPVPNAPVAAAPVVVTIPTDRVLVAKRDLPLGMQVGVADMDWQEWPVSGISPNMIRQSNGRGAIDEIAGSIARAGFLAGEPMRRDKLVKGTNSGFMSAILPPGHRAVAITIDAQGSNSAGGFVLSGDKVDIIRTYRDDEATKSSGADIVATETILHNVRVLAIGQNVQEKNGQPVMTGSTATLELDESQVEQVILAQRTSISGNLSLALRSMMDGAQTENAGPKVATDNAGGGLTIVRYGVASQVGKK